MHSIHVDAEQEFIMNGFQRKKEKDKPTDMKAYKEGSEERTMNGKYNHGFIAQEVKELDNDTWRWVYSENLEKLEMSYGKLVPILVKAIQKLKAEIV